MGKLVVTEFMTLDGVIEDPGGSEGTERGGWAFAYERGAEGDQFKLDELLRLDRSLLQERLVDELRLMVFPVVLGAGRRLFEDGADRRSFQLAETRQAGEVAILTLRKW